MLTAGGGIMGDDFLNDMGQRIHSKRKSLRFSQEELAEKAEISKQTVSRAENGQRELGARNVMRIARALELSADYLLTGEHVDKDSFILNKKIENLTDRQYRFLEEFVRNYIVMCEDDSVDDFD